MTTPEVRNAGIAVGALLASSATLVCCVLPAVLVSMGAGAVLVGLVSALPQLIWLSEHKLAVFAVAAAFLVVSGAMLWQARRLPCPTEPHAARNCAQVRKVSLRVYAVSVVFFALGALFAFVLPHI